MDILTSKEAAELLRVSIPTIRGMAASGEIPASMIGDDWRFLRVQLLEYLAQRSLSEQRHRREMFATREAIPDQVIKRGRGRPSKKVNLENYQQT